MEGVTHHGINDAPDRNDSRSDTAITRKHTLPLLPPQQYALRQQSPVAPQLQQYVSM